MKNNYLLATIGAEDKIRSHLASITPYYECTDTVLRLTSANSSGKIATSATSNISSFYF